MISISQSFRLRTGNKGLVRRCDANRQPLAAPLGAGLGGTPDTHVRWLTCSCKTLQRLKFNLSELQLQLQSGYS